LENATIVAVPAENFLHPVAIKGEWMKVKIENEEGTSSKFGWIRWKKGNQLLIHWFPLS
jgi:hypothetical protein